MTDQISLLNNRLKNLSRNPKDKISQSRELKKPSDLDLLRNYPLSCDICNNIFSDISIYKTEQELYEEPEKNPITHLFNKNNCICCDRNVFKQYLFSEKVQKQYEDFSNLYELRNSLILSFTIHKECKIFFENVNYEEYFKELEVYESDLKNYLEDNFKDII